ncbi:NYN domain-containing protein [Jeotgalibaca sp. A127]|uniref:NYN domain-containing protein n=1 Tax=Jeotgalibaca sp. A127 TaxID=3457324 RepID=UPI003FD3F744
MIVIVSGWKVAQSLLIEGIVDKIKNVLTEVTVATSDLAEQQLVFNIGANRMSALDLMLELQRSKRAREYHKVQGHGRRKSGSLTEEQLLELEMLRKNYRIKSHQEALFFKRRL